MQKKDRKSSTNNNNATLTCLHIVLLTAALTLLFYSVMIYQDSSNLKDLTLQKSYLESSSKNVMIPNPNKYTTVTSTDVSPLFTRITKSPNPPRQSKFAYTTLISGFDERFKYRGFIYNALIMKRALNDQGSTADFIAMVAFKDTNTDAYERDMDLLRSHGIIVLYLKRLLDSSTPLLFAEMALLKVTPWSFVEYERIQFLDGDVMPTKNMDCYFQLGHNSFTIGAVSPLNSGWFLAKPNVEDYNYLIQKALWRLGRDWDEDLGWAEKMPKGLTTRGGVKLLKSWNFNGADMDQGLLTHRFVLNKGDGMLVDTTLKKVTLFVKGLLTSPPTTVTYPGPLQCCLGVVPTDMFVHFTGQQKPWMKDLGSGVVLKGPLQAWARYLDALHLDVDSTTIGKLGLGSPLGFWNTKLKVVSKSNVRGGKQIK